MDNRHIRYCTTSDGVRIAFGVQGEGAPLLVCPVFIEAASIAHLSQDYQSMLNRVAQGRRLITYDVRGTGLSQRTVDDFSHQAMVRDIEAVAAAAELNTFDLVGIVTSGPRAIEFASLYPDRVSHLILYNTFARICDVLTPEMAAALAQVARANWDLAAQMLTDLQGREDAPNQNANVLRLMRESTTGALCADLIDAHYQTVDVTSLLAGIKVPTLVLHRMEQRFVKAAEGQRLAQEIPGAQFVPLSGDGLWVGADEVDTVYGAIDEFLAPPASAASSVAPSPAPTARLCAVLFTDVVGHTAIMSRLGDKGGREVLREHELISRTTLAEFGGFEVKALGDGFMASFESVASAMDCAVGLQRKFAERNESALEPLHVRIGLNAGEPIQEDGDLFGAMVITAARIAAKADAGEILIPDPVRHLLAGKDFVFADRGETLLKGFEDSVRLYEVSWRP